MSFYYLYREGYFRSVMAEVQSNFGETDNYWLDENLEIAARRGQTIPLQQVFSCIPVYGHGPELQLKKQRPKDDDLI